MNTRIVLGITGGIAAYKTPHLIRLLRKNGAEVKVVVTSNALPFVGSEALRTVSGFPVYQDTSTEFDIGHIRLTQWADMLLIAPATANTIAKISHGIADNLLTSIACAFSPNKIVIAPAMNTGMWENPATGDNITTLRNRGYTVLPVGIGELACGDSGAGRMLEIEAIAQAVFTFAHAGKPLSGKRVLISSGPTEEPIDPVRVITNRSSGKMGAALAHQALAMGADVTIVSGPAAVSLPSGAHTIPIRTATEMEQALLAHFATSDICIMAAAVSDFRPQTVSREKLHRNEHDTLTLELTPNNDILAGLGRIKAHQIVVGFALESDDNIQHAIDKMIRKQCDLMVFNNVDKALACDSTEITLCNRDGTTVKSGSVTKDQAAKLLLEHIIMLLGQKNG